RSPPPAPAANSPPPAASCAQRKPATRHRAAQAQPQAARPRPNPASDNSGTNAAYGQAMCCCAIQALGQYGPNGGIPRVFKSSVTETSGAIDRVWRVPLGRHPVAGVEALARTLPPRDNDTTSRSDPLLYGGTERTRAHHGDKVRCRAGHWRSAVAVRSSASAAKAARLSRV